jgi:hypothetical protein
LFAGDVSPTTGQQQNSVDSLGKGPNGPEVRRGNKLKIGEAEQGSLLVLQHLEDVLDVKGGSVERESKGKREFGSDGLQELVIIELALRTETTSRIQNHKPVEPLPQLTP